ncbi:MAG TPA: hypothetical protein VLZ51_10625 [Brevundimonas sp.]|nr:hypothetical protein [Brevundimonas sp.]
MGSFTATSQTMTSLILFLLFLAFAAILAWRLGIGIVHLRRVAIGGIDEDLDVARRTLRLTIVRMLILAAIIVAILFAGEWWAPQWRATPLGGWVLTLLSMVAGVAFAGTWGFTVSQQWSRSGTFAGVVRGVIYGFIAGAVVMLTIHWRWG